MAGVSVQVQTVVYKMDKPSLFRSLDSIANAVRVDRETGGRLSWVRVFHGDSSPEPTFTEQEVAQIRERYGEWLEYRYQFFNENTGTSRGHNRMAEGSDADYLVVMNPDIQYGPRFFEHMLAPFDRTDVRVGLTEARQTPIEHPKEYNCETFETPWSTGACFMVPTAVYWEAGGFDADLFFLYCDDVDLSWRIRLTGRSLIYQPLAPVYHPKPLDIYGRWVPTEAEEYYTNEALLFMCYKYSYDNHLSALLSRFQRDESANVRKAAESFLAKKAAGKLPAQLDPQHTVAKINSDYSYAGTRFKV